MANELTQSGRALRRREPDDMPRALLEFHSPSAGMIATPVRPGARSTIGIVTLLMATFLAIATFCPLNRVVTGSGSLVSTERTIVVQPFDQAIVHAINVHDGEVVQPGQVLAELDPTLSEANVVAVRAEVRSYAAEVARLSAEAAGKPYQPDATDPEQTQQEAAFLQRRAEYDAQVASFGQQITGAEADLAGFEASAAAYGRRLQVASAVEQMRLTLQKEAVGSRLNSLAAADDVDEMQRAEVGAIASANASRAKIASLKSQRDVYENNWRAKVYADLTDAERRLAEARDQLTGANLRHRLVIFRADKPAVVLTIAKVSVGSVLQPGAEFITLMPADTRFAIETRVRADESGYLRVGDMANVKFATFPFLTYGGAVGTVTNISADSFMEGGPNGGVGSSSMIGGAMVGAQPGGTYYRVRVGIDRYTLHHLPKGFRMLPGMPVSVDIKVGQRTIMQYLLSAVVPTLSQGMREP